MVNNSARKMDAIATEPSYFVLTEEFSSQFESSQVGISTIKEGGEGRERGERGEEGREGRGRPSIQSLFH